MKKTLIPMFLGALLIVAFIPASYGKSHDAARASFMKLPLSFVKNEGQKDNSIVLYEQGNGHATAFTRQGVSLFLSRPGKGRGEKKQSGPVTLVPVGASLSSIEALDRKGGKVNYFIGNDPAKWRTDIPTYGAVLYRNIYPGIDMKFYGDNSRLEYDIIVSPRKDPSKVRLSYKGIEKLSLTPAGDLEISLKEGSVYQKKPVVYQTIRGKRREIEGKFVIADASTYGFTVGKYDRRYPLVIDPALVYSTYLGGSMDDKVYAVAIDSSGNVYVTGETHSIDFPAVNAFQATRNPGSDDAFITKIDASGSSLAYSTYFGGTTDSDRGMAIAVDSSGCAYVAGDTETADFPLMNAYQTTGDPDAGNAFLTKFSASGNALRYSTYLGGTGQDHGYAIALDSSGYAYIAGTTGSDDFPVTTGAYQTSPSLISDAYVAKFDTAKSGSASLIYSTLLGGDKYDAASSLAVDSSGCAYVAGNTLSTDFPTTTGAYQTSSGTTFVTKFNASGSGLLYSTYFAGVLNGIAVNSSGHAYVAGYTDSDEFPVKNGYQSSLPGYKAAFVSKFDPSKSGTAGLLYSTYLGGSDNTEAYAVAVDSSGYAYVTGYTDSDDFPVTSNAYQTALADNKDAFVTKLDPSKSGSASLIYSTYMGGDDNDIGYGIAVDSSSNAYVAGRTGSDNFPVTTSAYQQTRKGGWDVFVARFDTSVDCTYTISSSSKTFTAKAGATAVTVTGKGEKGVTCDAPSVIVSDTSWITATLGTWAKNKGKATIAVTANTSSSTRTGSVVLEGNTYAITQKGATCAITGITPSKQAVPVSGGAYSFDVAISPDDCLWTASSNATWLTLDTEAGTGSAEVAYTAAANTTGKSLTGVVAVTLSANGKKKTHTVKAAGK